MTDVWDRRRRRPERKGQRCQVLGYGMNNALIQFERMTRVVTDRRAVR